MKREEAFNPIDYALEILRDEHGLDMSAAQLSKYLDKKSIKSQITEIQESSKFKGFRTDKEKTKFLYSEIVKYIVEDKPFDERGKRLFENDLESIVGRESFWQKVFSSDKKRTKRRKLARQDYIKSRGLAKDISYAVARNPQNYQGEEGEKLIREVSAFGGHSGRGEIADIFYAGGRIGKKIYREAKSRIAGSSKRVLEAAEKYLFAPVELAKQYVENPKTSYATAILGILLILLFNPIQSTGSVIGIKGSSNSVFSFIGLGLLFVSGLSFIFRGRKLKK